MSEWWTYGPRDLLMFSADTYYRLFESYNREMWPLQLAALAAGAALAMLVQRGRSGAARVAFMLLALAWAWVAWGYHWQRLADIHLGGGHVALAFGLQAALLAWAGWGGRVVPAPASAWRRHAGVAMMLFALAGFPLMAPLFGRGWPRAEVLGLMPDPTVLATLGVLLIHARSPWWLYPIPMAWCVASGATLWAMGAPDFGVLPLAALLTLGLAAAPVRGEAVVRRMD